MRSETIGAMAPGLARKLPSEIGENGQSRIRKAFNPVQGPKDVGIAPEITLARSNTENMAAALISDRAPDAFREKSKLLV